MARPLPDPAIVKLALERIDNGQSMNSVAKELGKDPKTIGRWKQDPEHYLQGEPKAEPESQDDSPDALPASDAPAPTEPVGMPGDDVGMEYTPPPKLPKRKDEKEAYTCGNCKSKLDPEERPRWCPGCEARLMWEAA